MKYKVNKNCIFQKLDNSLVGFDIDNSILYSFNETAEFIFKKLKKGIDEKEIAVLLAQKYEVDPKTALKDITRLLKDLKKNKILL